jgi:long-chain acyl-CoA synthetase
MSEELTEIFENMKKRYKKGSFEKKTTYYFSLGDDADHKWTVTLSPKTCVVKKGRNEKADCVLKTSPNLFKRMVNGKFRPGPIDFVMGKVKSNDPEKLRQLTKAFVFPNN